MKETREELCQQREDILTQIQEAYKLSGATKMIIDDILYSKLYSSWTDEQKQERISLLESDIKHLEQELIKEQLNKKLYEIEDKLYAWLEEK